MSLNTSAITLELNFQFGFIVELQRFSSCVDLFLTLFESPTLGLSPHWFFGIGVITHRELSLWIP
jgi:hypothetical protein